MIQAESDTLVCPRLALFNGDTIYTLKGLFLGLKFVMTIYLDNVLPNYLRTCMKFLFKIAIMVNPYKN